MRSVIVLLGLLTTVFLAGQNVEACSCGGSGGPCESYGAAAAVFVGTVVSARENERIKTDRNDVDWTPRAIKFSVEQSYLGVAGTELEVFTGRGGGDCGYEFKIGQRYLVYAQRYQDKLTTSICTRTKPFSSASDDLAFLGTLSSAAPGISILGQVSRPDKSEPLSPDVVITIEGESERREIRPDAEGLFRVSGLRAGKYKMALTLPETLTTWQRERQLTVSDRGCAAVAWYLTDNGRVSGLVVNAEGQPVPRILVSLVNPASNRKESYIKLERTDDDGRFVFPAVARGRYLIAVNHNRFPDPNDPVNAYPPSFYPGVIDEALAQAITVGPGEKLSDFEVRLPLKRAASILSGTVVWSDGSPVVNAQLSVTDVTQGESSIGHGVAADALGRFTINGYAGQKLIIEARSNRPYVATGTRFEPMERVEKLKITLERPTEAVRIIITKLR
jgi:hypothetical protein